LNNARSRIWITTPYFIPDPAISAALRSAVFRGVDVRILLPARGDHLLVDLASRSFYPDLLRSGVRIVQYSGATLHAKTVVLDDDQMIVGSANMDIRSFRLNFEVSCFVKCRELTGQLASLFERDLGKSREIFLADVEQTSYVRRLSEAVAHLLSPLL
ncbi:MAG: phospholipase D-like domain-containing protein, partial [Thermoguttaceae bacterium]